MKVVRTPHSQYRPKVLFDAPLGSNLSCGRDHGDFDAHATLAYSDEKHRISIKLSGQEVREIMAFWLTFAGGFRPSPDDRYYVGEDRNTVYARPTRGQLGFKVCVTAPGVEAVGLCRYLNEAETARSDLLQHGSPAVRLKNLVTDMLAGIERPGAPAHSPMPLMGWDQWLETARRVVDKVISAEVEKTAPDTAADDRSE